MNGKEIEQCRQQLLSLRLALQVMEVKNTPWPNAANVKYPLLTTATMQFGARSYPGLVGSANVAKGKVTGFDQSGGNNYIVLAAAEDEIDDWYNSSVVFIAGGKGAGQSPQHIHDYTGATDSITLPNGDTWATNPDSTSEYVIIGDIKGHVFAVTQGTK